MIKKIFVLLLISILPMSLSANKDKKEICITFDELPASAGFHDVDRDAVNYLILQSLKKHEVKALGFVVGQQIEESFDIIGQWLNEGHKLGNMTFSNQDFHQLGIEQFIEDVQQGEQALAPMVEGFGQKTKYFRYPFMHYGNTVEKKEQLELYLDSKQYHVVPATVVIDDYLYNMTLDKMGKEPDTTAYFALMNEYLNYIIDEIEASELLAKEMLGRSCPQILNLRANRINAVFLDELLGAIKSQGYTFITIDKALKDEIFHKPEAYFGSLGVSYLEMLKQSNPDFLPAE